MTCPLTAVAQETDRVRRIGVLVGSEEVEIAGRLLVFRNALRDRGWIEGRNVQINVRSGAGDASTISTAAHELVALKSDVILASSGAVMGRLLQATRSVPIVFVVVPDPVGSGFVKSLSHPGGNATGFMQFEYSLSGKWLELLKEIAPSITRAAIFWDPNLAAGVGQFAVIQSVAPSLGMEVFPVELHDAAATERSLTTMAHSGNGGLIITASSILTHTDRDLIVGLAAEHKLPAVYPNRRFIELGGLMSYAADFNDQYRRAAEYIDRIFKGEKPADLPVQAPTKYELVVNLKTAKALGLTVPQSILARADEVIE